MLIQIYEILISENMKHITMKTNGTSPQDEQNAESGRANTASVTFDDNITKQHQVTKSTGHNYAVQMEDLHQLFLAKTNSSHKNVSTGTNASLNNHRKQEYFAFAEYIADKLSNYDKITRSEVEFKISKLLYEADMTVLKKQLEGFVSSPLYCSEGTSPVPGKKGEVSAVISAESSYFTTDLATSGTSGYPSGTSSNYNAEVTVKDQ